MVEIGKGNCSARVAVQEPARLLAPAVIAEFKRVFRRAKRRYFDCIGQQLIGVGDPSLRQVGGAAECRVDRNRYIGQTAIKYVLSRVHYARDTGEERGRIEPGVLHRE